MSHYVMRYAKAVILEINAEMNVIT